MCSICRREIHAGVRELPEEYETFNEDYAEYKEKKKTYCPVCNKEKANNRKTCSFECARKLSGKVDWDSVDLEDLILEQKLSYCEIGRRLNVSDNAVRKRAKKMVLLQSSRVGSRHPTVNRKGETLVVGSSPTSVVLWVN